MLYRPFVDSHTHCHALSRVGSAFLYIIIQAFSHSCAQHATWPPGQQTSRRGPRSLGTGTLPTAPLGRPAPATHFRRSSGVRPTDRHASRHTDGRSRAPCTLDRLFLVAAARPMCCWRTLSFCSHPPPPRSQRRQGSPPCIVWSPLHSLPVASWNHAAQGCKSCLDHAPCLGDITNLSCPPRICLRLFFHVAVVKVARPLLSFLQPLASGPTCGSSTPAHTPQVWNATPSAPKPCMWSSIPTPHSSSKLGPDSSLRPCGPMRADGGDRV